MKINFKGLLEINKKGIFTIVTKKIFVSTLLVSSLAIFSQNDSTSIEKIRTESGVDPTRINSRLGYSIQFFDQTNNRSQIINKASITLGVNRWSFSIKPEVVTLQDGNPGSGFQTSFGDLRFSVLNTFYVKDRVALAGSFELSTPSGKVGYGTQYFSATPSLTFSYTFNPTLFLAIQPQYTFAIAKDPLYPDLQITTLRIFIAKFTKSGYFFVMEPRTIYDFDREQFDFIIAPILGKSLGAGFNLIGLIEIPTRESTRDFRGIVYQFGFNRNF